MVAVRRACNMSTVHARMTSDERRLWWNIDTDAAAITGCDLPCEYDLYDMDEVKDEFDGILHFPWGTNYVMQVALPCLKRVGSSDKKKFLNRCSCTTWSA